jgi:diacylglycerol kinase-like protein
VTLWVLQPPDRPLEQPPGLAPLGLIVNASARGVRRRYLRGRPFWASLLPAEHVRVTRSVAELDDAVAEFRAAGVRTVATLGGDGTVHHLVNALLRQYDPRSLPAVLPLAGGTMNGLARASGTGGNPESVLRMATTAHTSPAPPVQDRRILRITTRDGTSRFGFSLAAGLIFRALQSYYRSAQPGLADAIRASLLPITGAMHGFYDGVGFRVEADGAPWLPELVHSVLASVLDSPLLWFRPFGGHLAGAATFHLAATSMRPVELAPRLWAVFRGRCRHARLRVGPAHTAAFLGVRGFLVDGELYPSADPDELRVTVGPPLRLLVPGSAPRS